MKEQTIRKMMLNRIAFIILFLVMHTLSLAIVKFADADVSYSCTANSVEWVQKAYIAYYGRPGAQEGIEYWACRMDDEGGRLDAIMEAFGNSDEFRTRYGSDSNSDLIDNIFLQMFSRYPGADGKAYYVDQLDAGQRSLQDIALTVLNAAVGQDEEIINNKLEVGNYFTELLFNSGKDYPNITDVNEILATVDESPESIQSAKGLCDNLLSEGLPPVDNPNVYSNSLNMSFNRISAGTFTMGSPVEEYGRDADENEIQHQVTLTYNFYMMTTEVTQGQWKAVMGDNPSYFSTCGDNCPVENVSWDDVQVFIEEMNKRGEGTYRLPTEAEWEYVARAGTTTAYNTGDCLSTDQANYDGDYPQWGCPLGEYRGKTLPVASFDANTWGIYDMHGNVWEWCQDWFGDYSTSAVTDPTGPSTGTYRVIRGGSWDWYGRCSRSASRNYFNPIYAVKDFGFRLIFNSIPDATITHPSSGTTSTYGDAISFSGTGTDVEDGNLSNDSLVWTSDIDGQIGTGTSFSYALLSVGNHTITLTATDRDGATGTATVLITINENSSPEATIASPSSGIYTYGDTIDFRGSGTDEENGTLSGNSLVWTSNIDGQIGTGTSFSHASLSVGNHTITLTATDSGGATGTDNVDLTILSSSNGTIAGNVRDAVSNTAISGATVSVLAGSSEIASTTTDSSGAYSLTVAAGSDFTVVYTKSGYLETQSYNNSVVASQLNSMEVAFMIPESYEGVGTVEGTITNAIDGEGLEGVTLFFRKQMNNMTGSYATTATTQNDGTYSIDIQTGIYTVEARKDSFITAYFTAIALGGTTSENQNASVSPVLGNDELRIVLTWGTTPEDLDSHLTGPTAYGNEFHIYFQDMVTSDQYVTLDVDDTTSYGPETITISQLLDGTYQYLVHDYTNRYSSSSDALANSSAQVRVYRGSELVQTYNVPAEGGTVWTVFEIRAGQIATINTLSYEYPF